MKKPYLFVIITIVLLLLIFGFVVYTYNLNLMGEGAAHTQEIEEIKIQQAKLDEDFYKQLQEKERELTQEQIELLYKDEDGDGLIYAEEVELGTSDNEVDSDADGIWDNIDRHPAGGGETYRKTVHWTHGGLQHTTQFGIHEDKYWYYKDQPRGYCCGGWEVFATPNDPTIQTIAQDVIDVSISTGDPYKYHIAIDFVESMTYEYDIDYIGDLEYPKYAIETIIDERGDCEDTSFLMASILEALGIDCILFILPSHVAVGVWCEGCSGTYYNYSNKKYYFLETTGVPGSWQLGWGSLEGLVGIIPV